MNKSLLIIEDNENLRDFYSSALAELNIDVHTAGDGIEAFKKIAQKEYDLYIVDIFLPNITGLEVIKVLRERYEKAKILIVSAAATDAITEEAMRLGAAVLRKPFRLNELREAVAKLISPPGRGIYGKH